jgi:hypothetical protein
MQLLASRTREALIKTVAKLATVVYFKKEAPFHSTTRYVTVWRDYSLPQSFSNKLPLWITSHFMQSASKYYRSTDILPINRL